MKSEPTISELRNELKKLKAEKKKKMLLAQSYQEKQQLLKEIKQLEQTSKSPSKFKSFARSYSKGASKVGGFLWGRLQQASRNYESKAVPRMNPTTRKPKKKRVKYHYPQQKQQMAWDIP